MNASLKTRKNVVTFFTYLVLILGSISMIFPFVWMVLTSFKTQAESMAIPPQILPSHWNLDSFVKALQSLPAGCAVLRGGGCARSMCLHGSVY